MARTSSIRVGVFAALVGLLGVWGVTAAGANSNGPTAVFYLSSTTGGVVAGVDFEDEDVLSYNNVTDTWARVFDGSDVLPVSADVDAVYVEGNGDLLLSFQNPVNVAGLGIVDDSDVVRFTPDVGSNGDATAGTFTLVLDGSTVGLSTGNEDVTAVTEDGDLVVSTLGGFNVPGSVGPNLTGADEDLISLSGGTWSREFDGSDVALNAEDIWGAWIDVPTGEVYLSVLNVFNAGGVTGDGNDVFVFTGTSGTATSGTFAVAFDGDDHDFGDEQIDALSVEILAPPPPGDADLSVTKTDDVDPVLPGDVVTYTVEVSNAGPDSAENVVATDTLPAGVTLQATTGCQQDPNGLTCSLGTIAVGGTASYTISVQVDGGTEGTVTNDVVVAAGTADPVPGNNSASEDTLVGRAPIAADDGPATNSVPGDPFHTASNTGLAGPAGTLTNNDTVGNPAGTIVSFGGGDAGGDVTTYAAGAVVAVSDGSISIGPNGSVAFVPPIGYAGVFTVDYRLENVLGMSDATLSIFVGDRPVVAGGDKIYLSSTSFGTVAGIDFDDEDILLFDNGLNTWELFFDGSDVLPAGADVNGFTIDDSDRLLMTFQNPVSIAGLGTVDDSDVVEFVPTTLGEDTTGFFQLVLDGTTVGLTTNGEEINALTTYGGDLTVSTSASFNVPTAAGNQLGRNEDLIQLDGATTWSLLFDGSDVDLAAEDVAGASIDPETGNLYATSFNGYNVPGLSGDNNDVIVFSGNFGDPTAGTFSTFFDGDTQGIGDEQLDALHVEPAIPGADLSVVLSDVTDPVAPDEPLVYEVLVSNAGPEDATGVSVVVQLPPGYTFDSGSLGCFSGFLQPVFCSVGSMISGSSVTLTISTTQPTELPGTFTAAANVAGDQLDSNLANNNDTEETTVQYPATDLSLTLSDQADPVLTGGTLTYLLAVENLGPEDASSVIATLQLPAGTFYGAGNPFCVENPVVPGFLICTFPDILVGDTTTFTIPADIIGGAGVYTAAAQVAADQPDPNQADNTDSEDTTVNAPSADLSVVIGDSPDPVAAGDELTYQLAVTNNGPQDATGVTATLTLPAGVTVSNLITPCTETSPGVLSCSYPSPMLVGDTTTLTIPVDVGAGTAGTVTAAAQVAADQPDPNLADNTDSEDTTVNAPSADLSVVIGDSPDPVAAGDELTYQLAVTN
ncbi:MAG: DUF11 domain-containing protein, partial [Actinomycetota bacterium]